MNESMTSPIILIFWLTHFNPRSYERSDLKRLKMRLTHLKFQSTLLRKERPRPHQILTVLFFVPIHAPTKGATNDRYIQENEKRVSIHAPTKGATYTAGRGGLYYMFQSTLLRKERLKIPPLAYQSTLFQSTLLRKERPTKILTSILCLCFNPRSYERSDIAVPLLFTVFWSFNPRSYERSDCSWSCTIMKSYGFQSTLLRRERRGNRWEDILFPCVSIHAPTKGATPLGWTGTGPGPGFNPRSYERSDLQSRYPSHRRGRFNPRSYERSDMDGSQGIPGTNGVSIHAPTKGATPASFI